MPLPLLVGKLSLEYLMPGIDLRQLGYVIRKAREAKGLTQAELGEYLGMSRSNVGLLEMGQVKYPRIGILSAVAEYLNIDPITLFDLAGIRLTESQLVSSQLHWLSEQLDAEGNRLLIAIGHSLLQERHRRQGRGDSPSSPR